MRRDDEHMHSVGYRMIVNNTGLSPPKSVAEFVGLETNFEKSRSWDRSCAPQL